MVMERRESGSQGFCDQTTKNHDGGWEESKKLTKIA